MKTIRLLTIGSSLAENPLTYLDYLASANGQVNFKIGRANLGGCSLKKHWNLACYSQKHPEYKTYTLAFSAAGVFPPDGNPRSMNLQEALVAAPWDYVTLHQASVSGWRRESFQPHLGLLHGLVKELAPQAQVLLNQTWAYRSDAPYLPQNGLTDEIMFKRLQANYAYFASQLGCRVLPTGEAIQTVRRAPGRTFTWPDPDFDYQNAEAPNLPRQEHSLSVGWYWMLNETADGIPELTLDYNHLNAAGCYLGSCVWFECLTGLDVRPHTFRPAEVNAEYASFLRDTAHNVSRKYGFLTV